MKRPVTLNGFYRGTIAYDEPLFVRADSGTGKRWDQEYNRLRHLAWRNANRDAVTLYNREYKRKWRHKKRAAGEAYT